MSKEPDKVKTNFLDYLIFVLSTIVIFLSSIILAVASLLFFTFKLLTRKTLWVICVLILVVFMSAFSTYWFIFPVPWKAKQDSVSLIVREGESMHQVVKKLKDVGVLSDGKIFTLAGKITGLDRKIRAGRYDFNKGVTRFSVLRKLVKGDITYFDVTIPEGLTIKQIAGILKNRIGIDSLEFIKAAKDTTLIKKLKIKASNLEGYLFPNTYNLYWGISSREAVKMMVGEFNRIFDDSLRQRAKKMGFNMHKIVTLASMIERETQIDGEGPIISGVFHNRLKLGMLLQCDPTVIYALPDLKRPLYTKDLKVNSPYNTYRYRGLPPGPICSPGEKAILAALYPTKTKYLYFVAKGDGSHIFSTSLFQHNRARQKVKRELRLKQF